MNEEGTETVMKHRPDCDMCVNGIPPLFIKNTTINLAQYDGATVFKRWAYMCEMHFKKYGVGLGVGRGQKIIHPRIADK